jgi:hypothetical protein
VVEAGEHLGGDLGGDAVGDAVAARAGLGDQRDDAAGVLGDAAVVGGALPEPAGPAVDVAGWRSA